MSSITLNNSDFQCLQDQLVDLKTKNYELAEKFRRSQADFDAAKAKICTLQLKLEEQERDFQFTSATLRREIEVVACVNDTSKDSKEDDYKAKYKKLLHKAKELQQRYEKSVEIVQQLDIQNKNLSEKARKVEEETVKIRKDLDTKQKRLDEIEKEYQEKLDNAIKEYKSSTSDETIDLYTIKTERDILKKEIDKLTAEINNFDHRLESQAEERKIHERKGIQIVKELKRQLALEKNRTETLQKRLENLLAAPQATPNADLENRTRMSTSSSTNGNSSNGNGSRANQDANSVGSWSFVPVKTKSSNPALNETLSLCSIDSEDRETVQHPCDTTSEDSIQRFASEDSASRQSVSVITSTSTSSPVKQASTHLQTQIEGLNQTLSSPSYSSSYSTGDGLLIEEQAILVERLTRLQHDKWMLEEKLSYLEQANSSLSEDLANKSDIIRHYFMDQALKATGSNNYNNDGTSNIGIFNVNNNITSRKTSFPNNVNYLLSEKPSLKKVVDFLKERSQVSSSGDLENISREATKKMQLMLEETLTKCLKLQENLDFVTTELNKFKI